jgi:hypothetical protein
MLKQFQAIDNRINENIGSIYGNNVLYKPIVYNKNIVAHMNNNGTDANKSDISKYNFLPQINSTNGS